MEYTEIFKLKEMLENANIPFEWDDTFEFLGQNGFQIRLNKNIDVIQHSGSYGNSQDLLEIMGALTEKEAEHDGVLGWLTAEEVFKRFKYCYENDTAIYKDDTQDIYEEEKELLDNIIYKLEKFEEKDGVKISLQHLIEYCKDTIKEIENEQSGG